MWLLAWLKRSPLEVAVSVIVVKNGAVLKWLLAWLKSSSLGLLLA